MMNKALEKDLEAAVHSYIVLGLDREQVTQALENVLRTFNTEPEGVKYSTDNPE